MAHVADREYAGHAGFEQAGIAFERPALGPLAIPQQVRAGQDETALVALDDAVQPLGARLARR